jgi:hypothetical protein
LLGQFGIEPVRANWEMMQKEMERWKEVTLSTDFR